MATGRGTESDVTELLEHLTVCERCELNFDALSDESDTFVRELASSPLSDADEPEFRELYRSLLSNPGVFGKHSAEFDLPFQMAEYSLRERIGQGANGAVFLAHHRKLDRDVVVKVLRQFQTDRDDRIERFHREMRAIGSLDHPNIARATDAGEFEDFLYLVMEHVPGVDVSSVLRQMGRMPECVGCEIARQVAMGLEYINRNQLVHRDIKPSNLLLTSAGQIKVLDLGLVAIGSDTSGSEASDSPHPRGTADYMSPEQWQDFDKVDIRADLYGLGCTLFKLLIGRAPFQFRRGSAAKRQGHLEEPVDAVRQLRPDLSRAVEVIIERLLSKDAAERFQTPTELIAALQPLCGDLSHITREIPALSKIHVNSATSGFSSISAEKWTSRLTRRTLISLGAAAAGYWLWRKWLPTPPTVDTTTWRSLSPALPERLVPSLMANHIVGIDVEPPQMRIEEQGRWHQPGRRDGDAVDWNPAKQKVTVLPLGDDIVLANLGHPVVAPFSLKVRIVEDRWTHDAGVFFGFRSNRTAKINFHQFHSIEFVVPTEDESRFRILWSSYEVQQQSNGKIRATRTPLGDIEVKRPTQSECRLAIEIGRAPLPEVAWQDKLLTDWQLSFPGRKFVGMNPERLRAKVLGRIGLIARDGTTFFYEPRLKYET